ncbi:hypothetical protein ACMA1D_12825 [Streptomyces sp. 796.1]|uniref:hypothetical protein n=1 Tax=Streptomyces sp. 796.1 TaxID=3163029 RepID=UPI0039C95C41
MARRTAVPGRRVAASDARPGGLRPLAATVVAVLVALVGLLSPAGHPTPLRTGAHTPAAAPYAINPTAAPYPNSLATSPYASSPTAPSYATHPTAVPDVRQATGPQLAAGQQAAHQALRLLADEAAGPEAADGPHLQPYGALPRLTADRSASGHAAPPPGAAAVPPPTVFTPSVGWRAPPAGRVDLARAVHATPYAGRAPPHSSGI